MTVAPCVSTEMCRAFVRPSVVSAIFVLVVIQESFMVWPAPSPLGLVASSALAVFLTSGLGDWASSTVGGSIRAIVVRIRSARLMGSSVFRPYLWIAGKSLAWAMP